MWEAFLCTYVVAVTLAALAAVKVILRRRPRIELTIVEQKRKAWGPTDNGENELTVK